MQIKISTKVASSTDLKNKPGVAHVACSYPELLSAAISKSLIPSEGGGGGGPEFRPSQRVKKSLCPMETESKMSQKSTVAMNRSGRNVPKQRSMGIIELYFGSGVTYYKTLNPKTSQQKHLSHWNEVQGQMA